MAPLPANNTSRYILHYKANTREHDVTFRYQETAPGAPPDVFQLASYVVILNAVAGYMPNDLAYLSASYIPEGGSFSIPTDLPLLLVTGTQAVNAAEAPAYFNVPGRTLGGRRTLFSLLGVAVTPAEERGVANDYRITAAEAPIINALVTALNISGLVGIDGNPVIWKQYANAGYNSHWQQAVRT